jgi:hypothetical protein
MPKRRQNSFNGSMNCAGGQNCGLTLNARPRRTAISGPTALAAGDDGMHGLARRSEFGTHVFRKTVEMLQHQIASDHSDEIIDWAH